MYYCAFVYITSVWNLSICCPGWSLKELTLKQQSINPQVDDYPTGVCVCLGMCVSLCVCVCVSSVHACVGACVRVCSCVSACVCTFVISCSFMGQRPNNTSGE